LSALETGALGPPSSRIFYGWWLVLACLGIQAVAGGASIYLYSLFAGEVERAFQVDRATVMLAATGHAITAGLLGPKLGALLDRHSLRKMLIASSLAMGAGFVLISFTPDVRGFIAGYTLLIPIGSATLTTLFAPLLLSRWFVRQRGLAIGIAALGTKLGGFTLPPLVALLIDEFDWRFAMRVVGVVLAAVVCMLACWAIVDHPRDRGVAPDGDGDGAAPPVAGQSPATAAKASLAAVLADRNFWLASFGMSMILAMFSVVMSNLSMFATDIGAPRDKAALLLSLFALIGMGMSPIVGRLCDVLDIRAVFAGLLSVSIVALSLFALAESYQGLVAATVAAAVVGGGVAPFFGALVGRLFDLQIFGRVLGSMSLVAVTVSAVVPVLSGWLFDVTGSYRMLFLGLIVLMAIPLAYMPLIKPRPCGD